MTFKINTFFFVYTLHCISSFTITTKLINSQNAINLLVAYEMRMKKYENDNNVTRNNLQKYIKKKHQCFFDDIHEDKVLFTALCTVNRENSLSDPTYLINNKGNCASIVPLWNLYFSESIALISPYDALDTCDKYYFPRQISDAKHIYSIYNTSRRFQCRKSLL